SVRAEWGTPMFCDILAPSRLHDPEFLDWWARMLRSCVTRAAITALLRAAHTIDVRDVLHVIRVPTLVLHRRGNVAIDIGQGRAIAAAIEGARMIELEGDDHVIFSGDRTAIVSAIDHFLTDTPTAL